MISRVTLGAGYGLLSSAAGFWQHRDMAWRIHDSVSRGELMRYEESNQRRRLSGQMTQRGSRWVMSTGGGLLFGLPFVGVGVGTILIGLRLIHVEPKSVHAPYWVLTICGSCFFGAGLALWGAAIRQFLWNRRRVPITNGAPEAVALADYNWNKRGYQPSRWSKVFKASGLAIALTVFLSIFNWWAFFSKYGPFMVKCIVGLFDLILLAVWGQFFLTLARALKFSDSRIDFARFPYSISEPILIRWPAPNGISKPVKGSFTLRCLEEWWETTTTGSKRSTYLVKQEIWSGNWQLDPADELLPGKIREFSFAPAAEALPTNFHAPKPIYWEFEVNLEMSGPDFVETYLVPVYQ